MSNVLIVHASRHGGTAGIAVRIGEIMREAGHEATVSEAVELRDPALFDACVIGGGVYMGSWLKEGTEYLEHYAHVLERKPVWLFSSGPLPGSTKETTATEVDPIENALGPLDGPGSGGRRRIQALSDRIGPRDHRVFPGAFDPDAAPKTMAERVVRWMPAARNILPAGDFRDWPAVEAWAREIALALTPVAV